MEQAFLAYGLNSEIRSRDSEEAEPTDGSGPLSRIYSTGGGAIAGGEGQKARRGNRLYGSPMKISPPRLPAIEIVSVSAGTQGPSANFCQIGESGVVGQFDFDFFSGPTMPLSGHGKNKENSIKAPAQTNQTQFFRERACCGTTGNRREII
jgi:hypothetical protein